MKAFLKKEWMELYRTGRLLLLLLLFALFGIMNPAVAKLTPWLMETISDSFADTGIVMKDVTVTAMTSWMQFYKNIPVGLLIFVVLNSNSFSAEYQKGTLIPVVTKGLSRRKIVLAKTILIFLSWTALYWLCFGITYAYNAYFWDNDVASYLLFAASLTWLFGMGVAALFIFFSTIGQSATQALLSTGGVVMGAYILRIFPRLDTFLPIRLMDGTSLLHGASSPEDYLVSIAATGILILFCMICAVVCFERKRL